MIVCKTLKRLDRTNGTSPEGILDTLHFKTLKNPKEDSGMQNSRVLLR